VVPDGRAGNIVESENNPCSVVDVVGSIENLRVRKVVVFYIDIIRSPAGEGMRPAIVADIDISERPSIHGYPVIVIVEVVVVY
jgi:hypothetical protein